jgi:hypothetical protein
MSYPDNPGREEKIAPYRFDRLPPERAAEIIRMGQNTYSPKRALSRRLWWLRKKGLTDSVSMQMWEAMKIAEMSSFDIYLFLMKVRDTLEDNKEKLVWASMMINWHKMHHGEKRDDSREERKDFKEKLEKLKEFENESK